MATVGLLHPGEMGAAVGGCLVSVGHEVLWDPAGRSRATTGRALAAELTGVKFDRLIASSSVILSICPPHAALDVAHQVAAAGYTGCYVDANAVSVATAQQVAAVVTAAGASYVDGGIIGQPPEAAGHTRFYLSGPRASEVRSLFSRSPLAARALARAGGVERTLLAEWQLSQPNLAAQSERSATAAALKGWRWIGEMEEIAASMNAAGLPDGFHEAAAEVFDRASRADVPTGRRTATTARETLDTIMSALM